jgi:Alkylated DNA repair protein
VLGFLDEQAQTELTTWLDTRPWDASMKRRIQQYGWKYNFKEKQAKGQDYLGELPPQLLLLAQRIHAQGHCPQVPNQVLVNDYAPGVGIAAHTDRDPEHTHTVLSLSLISAYPLELRPVEDPKTKQEIWLPPGSLLVLEGEARHRWTHGIAARKSDELHGQRIPRGRRLSVTFRAMRLPPQHQAG